MVFFLLTFFEKGGKREESLRKFPLLLLCLAWFSFACFFEKEGKREESLRNLPLLSLCLAWFSFAYFSFQKEK